MNCIATKHRVSVDDLLEPRSTTRPITDYGGDEEGRGRICMMACMDEESFERVCVLDLDWPIATHNVEAGFKSSKFVPSPPYESLLSRSLFHDHCLSNPLLQRPE